MKNFIKNIKVNDNFVKLWLLFMSVAFCLVFTQNSPWFKYNTFSDSLSYQIVGKQWLTHGVVPYKDLYTNAGPLQLLLFGFGSFIKIGKSLIGIYLIEVAFMFISMLYTFKLSKIFFNSNKVSLLIVTLFQFFVFATVNYSIFNIAVTRNTLMFDKGGTVEEFCLPFISILVFYIGYIFSNINNNITIKNKDLFLIGLSLSCIFLIKFQVSIPFILLFIGYIIYQFINNKNLFLKSIVIGFTTFVLPIIITLIYFKINGGVSYLIENYFKASFVEPQNYHFSFVQKLFLGLVTGINLLRTNILLVLLFALGILGLTFSRKLNLANKIITLVLFFVLFTISFSAMNNFAKYLLVFLPLCFYGIIVIIPQNINNIAGDSYFSVLIFVFVTIFGISVGTANANLFNSKFTNMTMKTETELTAETLSNWEGKNKDNTKLITLFDNDLSLFNLTNTTPKTKYFYKPVSNSNEYTNETLKLLKNKNVDYIYTKVNIEKGVEKMPLLQTAQSVLDSNNWKLKSKFNKEFFNFICKEEPNNKLRKLFSKYLYKNYKVKFVNLSFYPLDARARILIQKKSTKTSKVERKKHLGVNNAK